MKHLFFAILTIGVFIFSPNVFSQTLPRDYQPQLRDNSIQPSSAGLYQVGELRGNVKSKVGFLPTLEYPREAISGDAEGQVSVQIAIDEEGNVTSANAMTGPQVLKSYCEQVAKRTKFRIYRVDGQPSKTTGELIYQFEIKKAGWSRVGADLTGMQLAFSLRYFPVAPIMKAFKSEWLDEREMLGQIARMKSDELEKYPRERATEIPTIQRQTVKTANGAFMSSAISRGRMSVPNLPTPERIAIFHRLTRSIRTRLADDALALWQFDLGVTLSSGLAFYGNPNARADDVELVKGLIARAPNGTSPAVLSDLKILAAKLELGPGRMDSTNEIARLLNAIITSN